MHFKVAQNKQQMVHCMQSPYKSIKSVQPNQLGCYFLVWNHDKIYKKVDKLKASF
jgi:hypothetical protein